MLRPGVWPGISDVVAVIHRWEDRVRLIAGLRQEFTRMISCW
jgi:hypothetical protein